MKREFLQSLKVGDLALTKDVIDAIMEENGRDIQSAKAAFADHEAIKTELEQARNKLKALEDQDVEGLRQQAALWQQRWEEARLDHEKKIRELGFQHQLEKAISAAGGRNAKAISALLDLDALRESQDPMGAAEAALEALKTDSGYLFHSAQTPPPYARGTGAAAPQENKGPATLAGALLEKFERK